MKKKYKENKRDWEKKKMVKKKREVSVLRSSPSRPSGGRGRGAASDLLSPPRRAPTVTGLSSLISSSVSVSPAATSPNVDTPTRRRARRRRGLGRASHRRCLPALTRSPRRPDRSSLSRKSKVLVFLLF